LDRKYLFDEVAINYDKRRANYGIQLFDDIMDYSGITADKSIIEVGCGTGKATGPFLEKGCNVTAIELGKNLASYTKRKYKGYSDLKVIQSSFEDYECSDNKFDMLYSATAFHWIPPEIGYKKAYRIIKNGGTLALFWSKSSVNDDLLYRKIQSIYNKFLPQWGSDKTKNNQASRYPIIQKQMAEYGFTDFQSHLYHNTRAMTGEEYIELLDTYSDHRALDKIIRVPLYNSIKTAIEESGNELIINDTVDLYLARKTGLEL
jgi:ubiquinone/menaquinone biosynthesis C-methylase UbiE